MKQGNRFLSSHISNKFIILIAMLLIGFFSVGGWDGSAKFSDFALTDQSRTIFANSCLKFILKYGFDGVDLDWEYPVAE